MSRSVLPRALQGVCARDVCFVARLSSQGAGAEARYHGTCGHPDGLAWDSLAWPAVARAPKAMRRGHWCLVAAGPGAKDACTPPHSQARRHGGKEARRQAGKEASVQASERASERASEGASKHTSKQARKQARGRASRRACPRPNQPAHNAHRHAEIQKAPNKPARTRAGMQARNQSRRKAAT